MRRAARVGALCVAVVVLAWLLLVRGVGDPHAPPSAVATGNERNGMAVPAGGPGTEPPRPPSAILHAAAHADDTPLLERLDALEQRAEAGDRAASCRLAAELELCRKLPKMREDAAFWERSAMHSDLLLEHAIAEIALLEQAIARAQDACAGIAPAHLATAWRHQLRAADLGDRVAALRYVLDPPLPERALDDLPGWAEYARRFQPMLETLAAEGDPNAALMLMMMLAGLGEPGQPLIAPDIYRAAIWANALEALAFDDQLPRMLVSQVLQQADRELDPELAQGAREAGRRLHRERLRERELDAALLSGASADTRDPRDCDR